MGNHSNLSPLLVRYIHEPGHSRQSGISCKHHGGLLCGRKRPPLLSTRKRKNDLYSGVGHLALTHLHGKHPLFSSLDCTRCRTQCFCHLLPAPALYCSKPFDWLDSHYQRVVEHLAKLPRIRAAENRCREDGQRGRTLQLTPATPATFSIQ